MDLKLGGRRALITGGSQGIGLAIARLLASEGCHLDLVARSADDLARASDELQQRHGVEVRVHAIDLAERGRAAELAAICPDIDILVNNAGATPRGTLPREAHKTKFIEIVSDAGDSVYDKRR